MRNTIEQGITLGIDESSKHGYYNAIVGEPISIDIRVIVPEKTDVISHKDYVVSQGSEKKPLQEAGIKVRTGWQKLATGLLQAGCDPIDAFLTAVRTVKPQDAEIAEQAVVNACLVNLGEKTGKKLVTVLAEINPRPRS